MNKSEVYKKAAEVIERQGLAVKQSFGEHDGPVCIVGALCEVVEPALAWNGIPTTLTDDELEKLNDLVYGCWRELNRWFGANTEFKTAQEWNDTEGTQEEAIEILLRMSEQTE